MILYLRPWGLDLACPLQAGNLELVLFKFMP